MARTKKTNKPFITHRRINNILTIVVIAFGLYLILTPFLPQVDLWVKRQTGRTIPATSDAESGDKIAASEYNQPNRLTIPEIGIDHVIHEGTGVQTLSKGIWRRPQTSTPDKGGNTVLVAHRFTYNAPAVFYHLDKLKAGGTITVRWHDTHYTYRIRETKIVEPDQIQIENNTREPILTLYTCTPMWTARQRLVVIADPLTGGQP